MCEPRDPDPRDDLSDASRAFSGVVDLLNDAARCNGYGFEASSPDGLFALLSLIRDKLDPASAQLQKFQPRD